MTAMKRDMRTFACLVFGSLVVLAPTETWAQPAADTAPAPVEESPAPSVEEPAEVPAEPAPAPAEHAPVTAEPEAAGDAAEPPPAAEPQEAAPAPEPVTPPPVVQPPPAPTMGVTGRITDKATGKPLADAPVLAVAEGKGGKNGQQTQNVTPTITTENGEYVLTLPPGRYTLRSYYDLYHGTRIERVRVVPGKYTRVHLELEPIVHEEQDYEEVHVTYRAELANEAAQLNLRRESVNVQDAISAEEISRSGDSSAASAARRVVGVTIDPDKQLIIRGLDPRYSAVLLNGVAVPSTDPDRSSVQLDIFPSQLLSSMAVVKTARPDLTGNFAGGVVLIDSSTFPRDFVLDVGLSLGANTLTTGQKRLTYRGGSRDWLGFDDGTRALPSAVPDEPLVPNTDRFNPDDGLPQEVIDDAARSFDNNWEFRRKTAGPPIGLDVTIGDTVPLKKGLELGYLASFGYDHAEVRKTGTHSPRPRIVDGEFQPQAEFQTEQGSREVMLSGLGAAGLRIGANHEISLLSLYSRTAEDEVARKDGYDNGDQGKVDKWQLMFTSRQLSFNQLLGDHRKLGGTDLRLNWNTYASFGNREQPDIRQIKYGNQGGNFRWVSSNTSGARLFTNLKQQDAGGTMSLNLPLWNGSMAEVGSTITHTNRDFAIRRYIFQEQVGEPGFYEQRPDLLFDQENIGEGRELGILDGTRDDDAYTARQRLYAGYASLETPLFGTLKFSGGARLEAFEQRLRQINPYTGGEIEDPESVQRTDVDVLPSGALVLRLGEQMYLRGAYGLTLSRPQIREIAPYQFYDFVRERNISGNPDLRRTRIHNADLRWEWFFAKTSLFAVSGFYKDFEDAVELWLADQNNFQYVYNNADGVAYGGEVELRVDLDLLSEKLSWLHVGGNFSLIKSEVRVPAEFQGITPGSRPMYGQSPYLANASLRLAPPDGNVSGSLVYNVYGPRLDEIGYIAAGDGTIYPSLEEQAFHSLDFVMGWQFHEHWNLKGKVNNLLFETRDFKRNDFLEQRIELGMSASLGISYTH